MLPSKLGSWPVEVAVAHLGNLPVGSRGLLLKRFASTAREHWFLEGILIANPSANLLWISLATHRFLLQNTALFIRLLIDQEITQGICWTQALKSTDWSIIIIKTIKMKNEISMRGQCCTDLTVLWYLFLFFCPASMWSLLGKGFDNNNSL